MIKPPFNPSPSISTLDSINPLRKPSLIVVLFNPTFALICTSPVSIRLHWFQIAPFSYHHELLFVPFFKSVKFKTTHSHHHHSLFHPPFPHSLHFHIIHSNHLSPKEQHNRHVSECPLLISSNKQSTHLSPSSIREYPRFHTLSIKFAPFKHASVHSIHMYCYRQQIAFRSLSC